MLRRLAFALTIFAAGTVPATAVAQAYLGGKPASQVGAADARTVPESRVVLPLMPHPVVGGGGSCWQSPYAPRCDGWRWRQCQWNPHLRFCHPRSHTTRTCQRWQHWCRPNPTRTCEWWQHWCQPTRTETCRPGRSLIRGRLLQVLS